MKKKEKTLKALAVILIVGFGLIQSKNHCHLIKRFHPFSISMYNQNTQSDTVKTNDSNLYIYTKKIIDKGINSLIPNL